MIFSNSYAMNLLIDAKMYHMSILKVQETVDEILNKISLNSFKISQNKYYFFMI